MKKFTKREKIRIYKLALKMYLKAIDNDLYTLHGMCYCIYNAGLKLYPNRSMNDVHSIYDDSSKWKEFFAYQPKYLHISGYWWATNFNEKRVEILTTLAEGNFTKTK